VPIDAVPVDAGVAGAMFNEEDYLLDDMQVAGPVVPPLSPGQQPHQQSCQQRLLPQQQQQQHEEEEEEERTLAGASAPAALAAVCLMLPNVQR
jgi:hypothetical protein